MNILIPFIDQIAYVQTLKEVAVEVESQTAITRDNVTLRIDGFIQYSNFKVFYIIEW
jgi:regulator of protease activity HflC (stomatin/prohibitin superfamily)